MNMMSTPPRRSLIERADDVYDFVAVLAPRSHGAAPAAPTPPATPIVQRAALATAFATPADGLGHVDIARLRDEGFIVPDAPPNALAEEFRLVKRHLLLRSVQNAEASPKDRMVLICSAQPNEGKTFCAVNLALSLASERDTEVLLVDADVAKPEVLSTLGLEGSAGLLDALADPSLDVERLIIRTDVAKLSVLPAGRAINDDTELLSSARAAEVIAGLAASNPRRIVIIDTAPALAASAASVLAHNVGRILMVVRADRTTESELRDAIALLDGCRDIALLLNGTSFFGTNRTFGSYYGQDK